MDKFHSAQHTIANLSSISRDDNDEESNSSINLEIHGVRPPENCPKEYLCHGDPEMIVPDDISIALVVSSHLLIITAVVAYIKKYETIASLMLFVYVTSILHWRHPRFNTIIRKIDVCGVGTSITFGSYLSTFLPLKLTIGWFVGVAVILSAYLIKKMVYVLCIPKSDGNFRIQSKYATQPYTQERHNAYRLYTYIHLICVHVFANALSLFMIMEGSKRNAFPSYA
jgi:hypothetical protein